MKRLTDVALSAAGLVVLSPLLVALAVWVKLDSPGPVFFRGERIGRGGRPFRMFKFRSMRVTPPGSGLQITIAGDARITRSGAVLQRARSGSHRRCMFKGLQAKEKSVGGTVRRDGRRTADVMRRESEVLPFRGQFDFSATLATSAIQLDATGKIASLKS